MAVARIGGEERRLLDRARRGDRGAIEALVAQAAAPAWRFSQGFCRNAEDARELAQDVLTTLLQSLPRFRGDASLSTWTYVVARRACAKRKRRAQRLALTDPMDMARRHDRPHGDDPARQLERRELRHAISSALADLPSPHREVVVLRDVEGLSASEVARVLGVGERAVKSRLHRARVGLRDRLAPFLRGDDARPVPLSPHCPDTARAFSLYVEGEIDANTCARMEEHVRGCAACAAACDTLRAALGACRAYGTRPVPRSMQRAVRSAVSAIDVQTLHP